MLKAIVLQPGMKSPINEMRIYVINQAGWIAVVLEYLI